MVAVEPPTQCKASHNGESSSRLVSFIALNGTAMTIISTGATDGCASCRRVVVTALGAVELSTDQGMKPGASAPMVRTPRFADHPREERPSCPATPLPAPMPPCWASSLPASPPAAEAVATPRRHRPSPPHRQQRLRRRPCRLRLHWQASAARWPMDHWPAQWSATTSTTTGNATPANPVRRRPTAKAVSASRSIRRRQASTA